MKIELKKKLTKYWFTVLQDIICFEIENLENEFALKKNKLSKKFEYQIWKRSNKYDEGGGDFRILRNGLVFEKVGVNCSEVYGKFNKYFKNKIPGTKKKSDFWASKKLVWWWRRYNAMLKRFWGS